MILRVESRKSKGSSKQLVQNSSILKNQDGNKNRNSSKTQEFFPENKRETKIHPIAQREYSANRHERKIDAIKTTPEIF